MNLHLILGDSADLNWAQRQVTQHHYLHQPVSPRARPMVYVVKWNQMRIGLIMLGIPMQHATVDGGDTLACRLNGR